MDCKSDRACGMVLQVWTTTAVERSGVPLHQVVATTLETQGVRWVAVHKGVQSSSVQWYRRPFGRFPRMTLPVQIQVIDEYDAIQAVLPFVLDAVGDDGVVVTYPVRLHTVSS